MTESDDADLLGKTGGRAAQERERLKAVRDRKTETGAETAKRRREAARKRAELPASRRLPPHVRRAMHARIAGPDETAEGEGSP